MGMEVWADSMAELLANSARAFSDILIGLKNICSEKEERFLISGNSREKLLYNLLNELLYRFDAERKIYCSFSVSRTSVKKYLICGRYEIVDIKKHKPKFMIKAVTLHMLEVRKEKNRFSGRVIFDA
jgi:SHS2 domain-containing protein